MNNMDYSKVYQKTVDAIAHVLSIDKSTIQPNSTFEQLNADSLDMVEIIMKLEEVFGIEISDQQLASFSTVETIAKTIQTLV